VSAEDYETLLLRLAAEEEGYARTFPPEAAERCRAEVATAIPDPALLDELAEVTIAIEPEAVSKFMAIEDEAPPFMPELGPDLPLVYEPDADPGPVAGVPAKFSGPTPPKQEPAEPRPTTQPPVGPPRSAGPARLAERLAGSSPSAQVRAESVVQPAAPRAAVPPPASPPLQPPPPPPPPPPVAAASVPPSARGPGSPTVGPPAPPANLAPVSTAASQAATPASVTRCRFCASALPSGRTVVFCPFCGHQLAVSRCPRCDAELEPGWRHCIGCGLAIGPSRTGP
jgi:hypothetical protein